VALSDLAIDGGTPVRQTPLPYGRQWIDEDDVRSVAEALRGDFLTTGPRIEAFERSFAETVGARHAVAVSSGTAALHAAVAALRLGPGDEVIVPTLTFVASANAAVYQGALPVLADVDSDTLLLDPGDVAKRITPRTRAIMAVDYAGQPCDYDALSALAANAAITIIADGCHALGATDQGRRVGSLAALTAFSLHPVKHVTAGEGGVLTTDDDAAAQAARIFRHHGMTRPQGAPPWIYEITSLGQNYRITDFQCALAQSQLRRLGSFVERRRELATRYDQALADLPAIRPLARRPHTEHAYHLYVVRLVPERLRASRDQFLAALRAEGILATLHYPLVHLHPLYRERFGTGPGLCPVAEEAVAWIMSLPLFPQMTDSDQDDVIAALHKISKAYGR
jgi:perosamine synthetase